MNDVVCMYECGVGAPLFLPKILYFIADRLRSVVSCSMCNRVAPRPVRGFGERQLCQFSVLLSDLSLRFSYIAGGEVGDVCVRMAPEVP